MISKINELIIFIKGHDNIDYIEHCNTRLRIKLFDNNDIDLKGIKNLFNCDVISFDKWIHILIGPIDVIKYYNLMLGIDSSLSSPKICLNALENIHLNSVVNGLFIDNSNINDPVFCNEKLGTTFSFYSIDGDIFSPIDGKVLSVFPTKHSINLVDNKNNLFILHLGVDTFRLNGKGFSNYVKDGDSVTSGQLISHVDKDILKKNFCDSFIILVAKVNTSNYLVNKTKNKVHTRNSFLCSFIVK